MLGIVWVWGMVEGLRDDDGDMFMWFFVDVLRVGCLGFVVVCWGGVVGGRGWLCLFDEGESRVLEGGYVRGVSFW